MTNMRNPSTPMTACSASRRRTRRRMRTRRLNKFVPTCNYLPKRTTCGNDHGAQTIDAPQTTSHRLHTQRRYTEREALFAFRPRVLHQ